jgi:hypothetical protein
MPRRLALLALAVAALAAPAPALAQSKPPPIPVSVSNGGCAQVAGQILCRLDVTFGAVRGAGSYTAAVISPNGSVTDRGTVGAGSATLWVPYVGDGTYSVRISAWAPGAHPAGP